ncbi:MAG: hypothetical protein WBF33_10825, partial [Candidatus Nitrosopolaris sp.]
GIFDNEVSYNIAYNSGIQDGISFIIEDDTFLVGNNNEAETYQESIILNGILPLVSHYLSLDG